jgi:tetratricopeptide (TPR) repeat protein
MIAGVRLQSTGGGLMTVSQTIRRIGILAAAALLVAAIGAKPLAAIETASPAPPPDPLLKQNTEPKKPAARKRAKKPKTKQNEKDSGAEFLRAYRAARALMLEHKYQDGIAAMHAIGHDEHPDVANYIGYAYRKIGDYDNSKVWYERALAADPMHVRTWSYYGMWQMEQGNRLKALDYLATVKSICGNTSCQAFVQLKAVIDGTGSY